MIVTLIADIIIVIIPLPSSASFGLERKFRIYLSNIYLPLYDYLPIYITKK